MEQPTQLDFWEFQKALLPRKIWTFQVIHTALFIGATLFLAVILYAIWIRPSLDLPSSDDRFTLTLLSAVHIVNAVISYIVISLIGSYITNPRNLHKIGIASKQTQTDEDKYVAVLFSAHIIRAAVLEGSALFGTIICMLAYLQGSHRNPPVYWLNLSTYFCFAVFFVWAFPTKDRLESLFRKKCDNAYQPEKMTSAALTRDYK